MIHRPILTHTRAQLAEALTKLPGTKALVMTMGALHNGHLQLVREAQQLADHVIVTIFVNPTQFAPGEDFDAYPRTLDADMDALETVGADLVWAPAPQDVYPTPVTVSIDPGPIARVLEGKTRPTHFAGVALVCSKVVNLVRPDVALYGQRTPSSWPSCALSSPSLTSLCASTPCRSCRAEDGVALSSRNQYLSDEERIRARALSRALRRGAEVAEAGAAPAAQRSWRDERPRPRPLPTNERDAMSLPSYGQRSDPRAAPDCPRHPGVRSVDYCKRCNRPMCVDCLIPTEVRSICVDCTSSKRGWGAPGVARGADGYAGRTYAMMAICILMYLATWVFPSLKSSLALVPLFLMSRPWTILTGAFLHGGLLHILFNMLSLYWVGRAIEPVLGWWRFLTVYLVSALGGSAFILAWCLIQPSELLVGTVGASGAVFGLFGAVFILQRLGGSRYDTDPDVAGHQPGVRFLGQRHLVAGAHRGRGRPAWPLRGCLHAWLARARASRRRRRIVDSFWWLSA